MTGWQPFPESREQREYDFDEMLHTFDRAMPEELRLGDFLDAIEVPVSEVRIGDIVYMSEYERGWKTYPVIGFGDGKRNGFDMDGVPYVERYDHDGDYS